MSAQLTVATGDLLGEVHGECRRVGAPPPLSPPHEPWPFEQQQTREPGARQFLSQLRASERV
jgi:hypothetical protein